MAASMEDRMVEEMADSMVGHMAELKDALMAEHWDAMRDLQWVALTVESTVSKMAVMKVDQKEQYWVAERDW